MISEGLYAHLVSCCAKKPCVNKVVFALHNRHASYINYFFFDIISSLHVGMENTHVAAYLAYYIYCVSIYESCTTCSVILLFIQEISCDPLSLAESPEDRRTLHVKGNTEVSLSCHSGRTISGRTMVDTKCITVSNMPVWTSTDTECIGI